MSSLSRDGLSTFAPALHLTHSLSGRPGLPRWLLAGLMALALVGAGASAEARGKTKAKGKSKPAAVAKKNGSHNSEEIAAGHRVAVFAFDGEDTYDVREHVVQALKDRGLHVDSSLRPVDTAEQYRDMGAALNISLYVHGKVKHLPADRSTATIVVRSAVSGRKLTSATFKGFRRGLPYDVEEKLWAKVRSAVARACIEARQPGRRHNKPMVIEAGTPL